MSDDKRQRPGWALRLAGDWRAAAVLGVAALALAVAVGVSVGQRLALEETGPALPSPMPEAFPIADAWRAAAAADEAAYLRCFTGSAREAIRARLARVGVQAFRDELRAAAEAALGIEWKAPQPAPGGGLRFPVVVLHEREEELFDYTVVKVGAHWKISSVVSRGRRPASPPVADRLGPPATQGEQR